jgi:predicted dehydrogenase
MYDLESNKTIQGVFKDVPRKNEHHISEIWPSGKTSLGWFLDAHLACQYDFILSLAAGQPSLPDFTSALKVQEILEAAYSSAADGGKKINLPMP